MRLMISLAVACNWMRNNALDDIAGGGVQSGTDLPADDTVGGDKQSGP